MVPTCIAGSVRFAADAIVFDKDGTLTDLDAAWVPRGARWIADIEQRTDPAVAEAVAEAIGLDLNAGTPVSRRPVSGRPVSGTPFSGRPVSGRVRPGGVLAVGTMSAVAETIRITLAQLGYELDRATVAEITEGGSGVVVAIGDVVSAFERLADAGFKIGVLTSDDRRATIGELKSLHLETWIDGLSCGDDGFAAKPDPASFLRLAERFGIAPDRIIMVGDSQSDVETGRNAGAAGVVVVDSPHAAATTRTNADAVVRSIDEFITD